MTITRLRLVHFQKHKKLVIELDPKITIVTGDSDRGKSSVIRAIRWLCCNQPSGMGFTRHGAEFVSVSLTVDGRKITRSRGKKGNRYLIDGSPFTAFGQGVPDEVTKLLNLSDVSFGLQHEPVFWLSLSPGECAKRLNEIVNLEAIDKAATTAASKVRQAKSRLEVCRERLEDANQQVASLSWVEEAYKDHQITDVLSTRLDEKRDRIASISSLLGDVRDLDVRRRNAQNASVASANVISVAERLREQSQRVESIEKLYSCIDNLHSDRRAISSRLFKLRQHIADVKTCPTCGKLV